MFSSNFVKTCIIDTEYQKGFFKIVTTISLPSIIKSNFKELGRVNVINGHISKFDGILQKGNKEYVTL